jgi:hypothetical protein
MTQRIPKEPPFPVGAKLRYLGNHESYTYDIDPVTREKKTVPLIHHGIEVVIESVTHGHQGTGQQLRDIEGLLFDEDTGQPLVDETRDGYSVYRVNAIQNGQRQGRIIWPDNASEWQRI